MINLVEGVTIPHNLLSVNNSLIVWNQPLLLIKYQKHFFYLSKIATNNSQKCLQFVPITHQWISVVQTDFDVDTCTIGQDTIYWLTFCDKISIHFTNTQTDLKLNPSRTGVKCEWGAEFANLLCLHLSLIA